MAELRPDLVTRERPDGGLDVFDPIFDRVYRLDADQRAGLASDDATVVAELQYTMILDTPVAQTLRMSMLDSKLQTRPRPAPADDVPDAEWGLAQALPPIVTSHWRDGERWRRLAEERAAGRRYLILRGLVERDAVATLRAEIAALDFQRMDTELVHAERHLVDVDGGELATWTGLMQAESTRRLFGAVLGLDSLSPEIVLNAWHMQPGDGMGVHPDGKRYRATLSLGLAEGWQAGDGGAIAFGTPRPDGFDVSERFLPHAGDACLFAPGVDTWHAVEEVQRSERYTLTGWWMMAADAGAS